MSKVQDRLAELRRDVQRQADTTTHTEWPATLQLIAAIEALRNYAVELGCAASIGYLALSKSGVTDYHATVPLITPQVELAVDKIITDAAPMLGD